MNLHTIRAPGSTPVEFEAFIAYMKHLWNGDYELRMEGNIMWECERVFNHEADEYEFPEENFYPWSDSSWDDFLTEYAAHTGIRLVRPA